MEKQAKPKNKMFKYLPRAVSAVNFQNPPFSPGRDKRQDHNINKHKACAGRGMFSGPINVSSLPDEVKKQIKNGSFEPQAEPTSPKISCMGQIKQKKKIKRVSPPQEITKPAVSSPRREVKKQASKFKRLFSNVKQARKSNASEGDKSSPVGRAPALCQIKRFSSGRDHVLANFDWTAQITPTDHRDYYSDEERGYSDQEDEEVNIHFSAPLSVGSGLALRPRKEVNLWKRRTMNPPRPLQLK